jgi:hypothetical protein
MNLTINNINFGNPTQEETKLLLNECLFDDLFVKFQSSNFPLNSSEETKKELNEIINKLTDIGLPDNKKYLDRYTFYDRNLIQAILNNFRSDKVDIEKIVSQVVEDVSPLIIKLKYHNQRPRPRQLSKYYKLKLIPYSSQTANNPSFPSGHTVLAYAILSVIANKIPEYNERAFQMIEDIAYSRVYLGLHYPSDNAFAYEIGEAIVKHPKFTEKHGI